MKSYIMPDDTQEEAQQNHDSESSRPPGFVGIVDLIKSDVDNAVETDISPSTGPCTSQPPSIFMSLAKEVVRNDGKSVTSQYMEDLGKILYRFQQTGYLCDTVLVAEDGQLKAHGAVLAAASPVFNSSLNQNASGAAEHVIILPGIDLLTTEIAVRFAYTGKLVVPRRLMSSDFVSKLLPLLSDLGLRLDVCLTKISDHSKLQSASTLDLDNNEQILTDNAETFVDSARQLTLEQSELTSRSRKKMKQTKTSNTDNSHVLRNNCEVPDPLDFGKSTADEDSKVQIMPDDASDSASFENESSPLEEIDYSDIYGSNRVQLQHDTHKHPQRLKQSSLHKNLSKLDRGKEKHSRKSVCEKCGKVVASKHLSLHLKTHARKILPKTEPENGKQQTPFEKSSMCPTMSFGEIKENTAKTICEVCGKVLAPRHFALHKLTHTLAKPYRCEFCGRCFSLPGNLRRHMSQHTGERRHVCELCGASFIQQSSLHDHRWSHHRDSINVEKDEAPFTCRTCGEKFFTTGHLREHRNDGHQIKPILTARQRRRRYHQGNPHRMVVGQPPYQCPDCPEKFLRIPLLVDHAEALHSCKTPFVCCVCSKRFSENKVMLAHYKLLHTGGKGIHRCPHCDRSFMAVSALYTHKKRHNPERKRSFKCGFCDKDFWTRQDLMNHENLHKGIKPFHCTVCGKDYRQPSHLRRHMLVHTGERNYVCNMCTKTYKNLIDLRLHLERVHQVTVSKRPGCKFSNRRVEVEEMAAAVSENVISGDSVDPVGAGAAGPLCVLSCTSLNFD